MATSPPAVHEALHMDTPQRVDVALQAHGLCISRSQAQACIAQGQVQIQHRGQWQVVRKASHTVHLGDALRRMHTNPSTGEVLPQYVSRGGLKLHHALQHMQWRVAGLDCLDFGQSTGGFTDCLLQHGAANVTGFDVGHGQLHPSLRGHPQVVALEGVAVHNCDLAQLRQHLEHHLQHNPQHNPQRQPHFAVMDVSFISAFKILPLLTQLLAQHSTAARALVLIKPQFEVGPQHLNKHGIVKNPDTLWLALETKVKDTCLALGWGKAECFPCAITGSQGNQEYFVALQNLLIPPIF